MSHTHLNAGTMVTTGLASRVKTAPCVAAEAEEGRRRRKRKSIADDATAATRGSDDDGKKSRRLRQHRCRSSLASAIVA